MCKRYIGQTGRKFKQRYKEHVRYIRNNDPQSAYGAHILNIYMTTEPLTKLRL